VLGSILAIGKETGGFDHDLRANTGPIEFGGILGGEDLNGLAADGDGIRVVSDGFGQGPENGIVLEQVRKRLGIGQIIDRYKFDVSVVQTRTNDVPADPAEAINTYFDCHCFSYVK
jgi:hypothetical protein